MKSLFKTLIKSSVLFALIMATYSLSAQPTIEWQKCYGGGYSEIAYSIMQTSDDGYIIAGNSNSKVSGNITLNHGGFDSWIVKINSSGVIQWQKCLGGSGDDRANSIHPTTDGGYIFAGFTTSNDGDVTGNHGSYDCWVVKLNSSGVIQWQKALGGTGDDRATSIKPTTDGGYIFAGYTNSTDGNVTGNHGSYDCWVVKLSSSGEIQWQKALGGTGDDRATSIKPTADGGYIFAGYTTSNNGDVSGNNGGNDCWVVKLSSSGGIQWQKTVGGSQMDIANSIEITSDGGYIVGCYTNSTNKDVSNNHGDFDFWAVKLDTYGAIQWQKCLGGTGIDYGQKVKVTHDNGYIFTGYTRSNNGDVTGNHGEADFWVVKLDGSGSLRWQKTMGGSGVDTPFSVWPTKDGGFIVAGSTTSKDGDVTSLPGAGYVDFWVVKLGKDPSLPVRWLSVDATLNGNTLQVDWKVASETNTAHFEVQASDDGIHFSKIGENIGSKVTNGNPDLNNSYHFSYTFNCHLLGSGIVISLLGWLLAFRQKNKWIYILVLVTGIVLSGLACTKSTKFETKNDISKLFIRIAQVNKDGTKDYSKVIKVK